jgi:hypothetical protein
VALAAAAVALTGCGEGDAFTGPELVSELNAEGAELELGEQLPSTREELGVFALRFADDPPAELPAAGSEHGGSGSLTITEDSDAGLAEFERCGSTGALLCFRAANAVLIFEDELAADDRAQLDAALQELSSD